MTTIKNVSPLGELDVPLLGRVLEAGEVIEVDDDIAERLLPQAGNYEPVDATAKAIHAKLFPAEDTDPEEGEGDTADEDTDTPDDEAKPATKRTRRRTAS